VVKIEINGIPVKISQISLESLNGLKSLDIANIDGAIRADLFQRPNTSACFRCINDKLFYGNLEEALKKNVGWLTET
jgi:hypothetical protein